MLKAHLSQKYLSFAKNAQLSSIVPTTPRMNQCCLEKPISAPVIMAARSPDYKRKRIFQNYTSPQSKLTAKFNSLTESTVQPYSIANNPTQTIPIQIQTFKKKLRTSKENGLNFQKKNTMQLKKQIYKKTIHLKSQGNIQPNPFFLNSDRTNQEHISNNLMTKTSKTNNIQQNYSRLNLLTQEQIRLKYTLNKQQSEQSLIIQHYTPQPLTFNSQKSSLRYSNTNYQEQYMQSSKKASFYHNNFITIPLSPSSSNNKI